VNRYSAVHQFHSGTARGDAITQQMFQLQGHLNAMGIISDIFAEHIDPSLQGGIHPVEGYPGSDSNLMLLHHSMGSESFDHVVGLPDDVVAVYHNITPEHYFTDEGVRRYIRLGREQLERLALRARLGVADSNYNRREMLRVGFRRAEVLPVRVDFSEFAQPSDRTSARSEDWLFVGRIVGNKCQHDLVQAFAVYAKAFGNDSRLVLIGDTSSREYVDLVRQRADTLGIGDRVIMPGKISDRELRSEFARAGVFVSLSEHEGFGVPVLEAMAAGLPVVAFGAAAIPETMGGAGILLRTKDAAVVAATVQSVLEDADLCIRLVERQFRRIHQVESFDAPRLLQRVISRASGAELPLELQVQGPFETSYSLAAMNRRLAVELDRLPGREVSIYATEGPGDYEPAVEDLKRHPRATELLQRSTDVPYPDVVIRQMYPPRVIDTPGGITCEYFGWEESRIPDAMANDFNRYLDGVGVMSEFVRDVLWDSGVNVPIRVVGNGVDCHDPRATVDAPELKKLREFRFLHISAAFPRKGVDVLLKAYFSMFDGQSDVTLMLKTYPNPHNQVDELLQLLRSSHPNPPDVRWIDRDLDDRELQGLYNLAHCYVHPARGEGFGLPVAEAMAAGVPVISVAHSGLADFVSRETAVTIPFRLEPAQTHLEIAGSMWAEPDRERLAVEMSRLVANPGAPEVRERVQKAAELVATKFSWGAAAKRWGDFIDHLEDSSTTTRVAMVSPWNSHCGVAEYSRYIVEQGGGTIAFELFADKVVDIVDLVSEFGVTRCWSDRSNPDLAELEAALRTSDADVVHIQFNFGFFELKHLAEFIDRQLEHRGVVVTLHRTKDIDIDGELVSLKQIHATLGRVDQLITHQEADAQLLGEFGLVRNVRVVPQGAPPSPPITHTEARLALNLGTRPVIGAFGFLLPHKGIVDLIRAVDTLRTEFPDLCLLALCARHPSPTSREYEYAVREEIDARGLEDNVVLISEFLPDRTAAAMLRGVDAIVLPYHQTEESSSAALRFVLPIERPIIATDLPIFDDARDALLLVDADDPSSLTDAVRQILVDGDLRRDLADRSAMAARQFRWQRVADHHRDIYTAARRAHSRI
jgi:glycosyltransferase involved in cell wall biosynthesis